MKFFSWIAFSLVVLVCVVVQWSVALPSDFCHSCGGKGYPHEKCCNECPACRYHFDVEAPKDPGCRKMHNFHYDVEKFTDCHKETYDRLDAAVEVLPDPGCRKSYNYHYDVHKPCYCEEEDYDTHDFEVVEPQRKKKCSKVKMHAYADHPVRECQCDCNNRRYVKNNENNNSLNSSTLETLHGDSEPNSIPRLKRSLVNDQCEPSSRQFFYHTNVPMRSNFRARNPFPRRLPNGPRLKRKEYGFALSDSRGGFVCHCIPADQQASMVKAQNDETVGAPKSQKPDVEPAVYIGDSSNPMTYEQIKKHLDALPKEESSPTTNDIIGNLTVLFYDIYQQKHKKNFTLPLKYGTRTVIDQGDGLQTYDIEPIEGEYKAPKINRVATKGLNVIGRKIDRKTGQNSVPRAEAPRRNRLRRRP
uniref:Uncharacterized protein n=1 Tax=Anopheles dirus TaxID=7168 RepID=A0A182NSE9_9DIPT